MRQRGIIIILLGLFIGTVFIYVPENARSAAPAITEMGATPTTASWVSNIDFFMNYSDSDNDAPAYVRVEIGGTNYTMIANDTSDTTYSNGKYYFYERTHFWNTTHNFRFWVSDGTTPVSSSYQTFTIASGMIYNITSAASDGEIYCRDATYADCLDAVSGSDYTVTTNSVMRVGQGDVPSYNVYQSFPSFDTSSLLGGTIVNYVTIFLATSIGTMLKNYTANVYTSSSGTGWWDTTTNLAASDYIAQASVSGMTNHGELLNSSTYNNINRYFALNANPSWANVDGETRYVVLSSNYGTQPSCQEFNTMYSYDSASGKPFMLIDVSTPSIIEITNPKGKVHGITDMIAKVTSSNTVDQVTFYLNKYYVATYNPTSETYRYSNFNTELLSDGYYTIIARVNFSSEYATDEIQILVNNDHQDCWFDYIEWVWNCPEVRYYVPNNYEAVKGHFEMTKGTTEYTYWAMEYLYIETSTGTSNAFYQPYDSTTYTDNDPYLDEFKLTNYDYSNRAYINDTKSTASTSDDTELQNTTYLSYYIASGQNVTVESAVSVKVYRVSDIFIAKQFEWGTRTGLDLYTYQWVFANNLQSTIERASVYIPFKEEANIDSVLVKDADGDQLNAGKDYDVTGAGVFVGFKDLSSGSTLTLTITHTKYVFGTDIIEPTITITDNDVQTEPTTHNGKQYTWAIKTVTNPNSFKFTGRMYVKWETDHIPDFSTMDCEDSSGSDYECHPDMYGQLIVQGVSFGIGDEDSVKTFYFYYNVETEAGTIDLLVYLLAPIIVFLYIIGAATLVALIRGVDPESKSTIKFACALSWFVASLLVLAAYVVPRLFG